MVLRCAVRLFGAMLLGAFTKGVLLGGAGATLTAVTLVAARGCTTRGRGTGAS
mgnify:CR=1 FL=1